MQGFRQKFDIPNLKHANWFPGHMAKAIRKISRRLQKCDCVLEVHDARIPFSGRNPKLNLMLRGRPKILVLNKEDLCDQATITKCKGEIRKREDHVIYTNLRSQHHPSIFELHSLILKVTGSRKTQTDQDDEESGLHMMVLGMPNVGKSSLINAIRRNFLKKGKGTSIARLPGCTRSVSFKIKVAENPTMYLLDTPGVMMPSITNGEVALKLAVAGMLQDQVVGEKLIADYLLYLLNKNEKFNYVEYCKMESPSDDIDDVLNKTSQRIGALLKGGIYDYTRAAEHFLKKYREGHFGQLTFDHLG